MFVLDTNVLSAWRGRQADPSVATWCLQQDSGDFHISVLTLMELEIGVLRMERRDARQGAELWRWLSRRIRPEFSVPGRTPPVDAAVALRCAQLHAPDPRPERDALIAATALVHGMTVVTRDIRDFEPMGVRTVNPWETA